MLNSYLGYVADSSTENSLHEEKRTNQFINAMNDRNPHRYSYALAKIELLLDDGVLINTPIDLLGTTPIEDAIRFADFELFKLLVNKGAKLPEQRTNPYSGFLHEATYKDFYQKCSEYVNSQADFSLQKKNESSVKKRKTP
jgi:ankyrin repeat protein